jgi:hypothetical protein
MDDQDLNAREERQIEALGATAQMAGLYRAMYQTAGFQDLKKELDNRIGDLKNKWLTAEGPDADKIKIRAQVFNEVFDIIKSRIMAGDMAARTIDKIKEERASQ